MTKTETFIRGLRARVLEAEKEGNYLSADDSGVLLALLDSYFNEDLEKKSVAEEVLLSFELAVEHGAFDDDDDSQVFEDLDSVHPEDDDDEEEELPPGVYPQSKEV